MVSKAKLYSQLDRMEDELKDGLIPHLEHAAAGKNELVFCVSDFGPFDELRYKTDSRTEELVQLGRKILALREKLGEISDGTIAEKICWYCRKWSDSQDGHRQTAQYLAKQFLEEIPGAKA